MELKILDEGQKQYQQEVIDFKWEPVQKNPKRYGVLYPIIGYIVSLLAIALMRLGIFMWLFLIGGGILFFGGIYCVNGIVGKHRGSKKNDENP